MLDMQTHIPTKIGWTLRKMDESIQFDWIGSVYYVNHMWNLSYTHCIIRLSIREFPIISQDTIHDVYQWW